MSDTITFRAAERSDSRTIAEMFRICSGGVAEYIWRRQAAPGQTVLDVGAARYARDDTAFSYRNCTLAEDDGGIIGMLHAYAVPSDAGGGVEPDPVLRPYAELDVPGSYYLAGAAVRAGHRDRGIGTALLARARTTAARRGLTRLSALVFEGNAGSLRLLARHGFVVVDGRPVVPHPLIPYRGSVLLLAAAV